MVNMMFRVTTRAICLTVEAIRVHLFGLQHRFNGCNSGNFSNIFGPCASNFRFSLNNFLFASRLLSKRFFDFLQINNTQYSPALADELPVRVSVGCGSSEDPAFLTYLSLLSAAARYLAGCLLSQVEGDFSTCP